LTTSRSARLLRAANRHARLVHALACALMALPALLIAWDWARGTLATNPLEQLIRAHGEWALNLLLAVLAITPLRHALVHASRRLDRRWGRRWADWNWLIRLRRPIGLASFFYALAHVGLYAAFDVGWDWSEFAIDLRNKPFVLAGIATFALLLPLAITSTDAWMRRLKRGWKRLHTLVYPAAMLAVLHFVWLSKPGVQRPYIYGLLLALLLLYRVAVRWLARDTAVAPPPDEEAAEREQ